MGLLSFVKNAGEKLFGHKEEDVAAPSADVGALNQKAADAIKAYIEKLNLGLSNLAVSFDGASGQVTLSGDAPTQEAAEKAALAAGNVSSVGSVTNNLSFPESTAAQYHDVVSGDTLSGIAKKYYGDANQYMKIFEANKPMLSHPDKIYVGQKLRIPA